MRVISFAAVLGGLIAMCFGTSQLLADSTCSGGAHSHNGGAFQLSCGGSCDEGFNCGPYDWGTTPHPAGSLDSQGHLYQSPWQQRTWSCECVDGQGGGYSASNVPCKTVYVHRSFVWWDEDDHVWRPGTRDFAECVQLECALTCVSKDDVYTEPPGGLGTPEEDVYCACE